MLNKIQTIDPYDRFLESERYIEQMQSKEKLQGDHPSVEINNNSVYVNAPDGRCFFN